MIEFLSGWTKGLGVTIVIVSILEMLLPNNKTKKYIRMVLGVFVIFNIISPLIQNKDKLNLSNLDFEDYTSIETTSAVNQTSMDERINKLYEEELENLKTVRRKEVAEKLTTFLSQKESFLTNGKHMKLKEWLPLWLNTYNQNLYFAYPIKNSSIMQLLQISLLLLFSSIC